MQNGRKWLSQWLTMVCLFKINNRNTTERYEIYSELTKKTLERRQWRRSSVFILNLEHI